MLWLRLTTDDSGCWFGVAVTALVTSTKFSYMLSPVSTGIDDRSGIYPGRIQATQPGQPPWVCAMSTVDGFSHF